MAALPTLSIIIYSFTLWFGLYLLARDSRKPGLRYAGLGLVSYAVGLAFAVLLGDTEQAIGWYYLPFVLPSAFWLAATLYLVPDVPVERVNISSIVALVTAATGVVLLSLINPLWGQRSALLLPLLFLIGAMIRVRQAFKDDIPRRPLAILLTATLFFALATALLLLPLKLFTQDWALLGISFDVVLLGYAVAVMDSYDEGTSLLPDALRSLLAAALAAVMIGGQIAGVIIITGINHPALIALVFGVVTVTIVMLTFGAQLQSLLDAVVFATAPAIKHERDKLRAASSAAARLDDSYQLQTLSDKELTRLTRRALSHYGDLDKLAANPLTKLPLITQRLSRQDDNVLSRANELKAVLREAIDHLKPDDEIDFDMRDEWRYYNVLYFPYVVGIKPFSQRYIPDALDEKSEAALDWIQTYVPERTLYNWQNTAAGLVAKYIRDCHDK